MSESRGNPNAIGHNRNGTSDRGLMQINSIHADMVPGSLERLYEPQVNLAIAYKLYKAHGWSAWMGYTSGNYKKFM